MSGPGPARTDEGHARRIFYGVSSLGSFCLVFSLGLGVRGSQIGAAIFLLLALIGLVLTFYYGRIYFRLRRERWDQELARPQEALEQLFAQARADQAVPPAPQDADGA